MNLVRKYREKAGLSQRELAADSGVARGVLARVELDKKALSRNTALKVGVALGLDPVALYLASQSGVIKARVRSGEITHGQALEAMARVAVTVKHMADSDELEANPEMTEAVEKMGSVIDALEAGLEVVQSDGFKSDKDDSDSEEDFEDEGDFKDGGRGHLRSPEHSCALIDQ